VYRTAIGKTLYLTTKTRPDIAVAVEVLARQVSAPAEVHWTAVKRILRYLKGTMMYGLHIAPTNDQLIGHADADWGGESGRKSVSGFIITLGNVPVSWGSNKQTAAALSSTEAEYASLSEAARETVWLRRLVEAMRHPQNGGTVITQDKTGSVTWANGAAKFARSRHVGIKMHHVQNLAESKKIITQLVGIKEMLADTMTKPISGTSFKTPRNAPKICSQENVESHNTSKHLFCAWVFKPN
jgi:hypothetical protein